MGVESRWLGELRAEFLHGFGAEIVAGGVVFDTEAGEGVAEGVARGVVFDCEAIDAAKQGAAGGVGLKVEEESESAPSFAGLEGTVAWIFVFGVFGCGAGH